MVHPAAAFDRSAGRVSRVRAARPVTRVLLLATAASHGACTAPSASAMQPIGAPPPTLKPDAFYARSLDAAEILVSRSRPVPDAALRAAQSLVTQMLAYRTAPTWRERWWHAGSAWW